MAYDGFQLAKSRVNNCCPDRRRSWQSEQQRSTAHRHTQRKHPILGYVVASQKIVVRAEHIVTFGVAVSHGVSVALSVATEVERQNLKPRVVKQPNDVTQVASIRADTVAYQNRSLGTFVWEEPSTQSNRPLSATWERDILEVHCLQERVCPIWQDLHAVHRKSRKQEGNQNRIEGQSASQLEYQSPAITAPLDHSLFNGAGYLKEVEQQEFERDCEEVDSQREFFERCSRAREVGKSQIEHCRHAEQDHSSRKSHHRTRPGPRKGKQPENPGTDKDPKREQEPESLRPAAKSVRDGKGRAYDKADEEHTPKPSTNSRHRGPMTPSFCSSPPHTHCCRLLVAAESNSQQSMPTTVLVKPLLWPRSTDITFQLAPLVATP